MTRLLYLLPPIALLAASCAGKQSAVQPSGTPAGPVAPVEAPVEASSVIAPWHEEWERAERWIVASSVSALWLGPTRAAQDELFACFEAFTARVAACRNTDWSQTKLAIELRARAEYHGPPDESGHPLVVASLPPDDDECLDTGYDGSQAFDLCVERAVGGQFSAAPTTIEPVTLVFTNVRPSTGVLGGE